MGPVCGALPSSGAQSLVQPATCCVVWPGTTPQPEGWPHPVDVGAGSLPDILCTRVAVATAPGYPPPHTPEAEGASGSQMLEKNNIVIVATFRFLCEIVYFSNL